MGAGFSVAAGAPLVNNFLDLARELYDNPTSDLDDGEREIFGKVFDFKQAMSRAREKMKIDLDNIENLFGLVEMQQRLKHLAPETRNATVYLIAKTIQLSLDQRGSRGRIAWQLNPKFGDTSSFPSSIESDTTNNRYFADMYDFFAGLIAGCYDCHDRRTWRQNTVITFNYDLVLDDALWRVGFRPEYHLEEAESDHGQAPAIAVLKLHGSTNWQVCSECKHIVISRSKATGFPLDYRLRSCHKCKKGHFQLLLVPPSWDKTEHQGLMRPVWEAASEALNRATRICIIGYSMPEADAFFKYLITLGLADNHQLYRLIVVNKDSGVTRQSLIPLDEPRCAFETLLNNRQGVIAQSIEARYRDLFESTFASRRFHYFGEGFEMFLGNGYVFPQLGRGELISSPNLYGG
ncbi:MAG TPA: SIR2 family protein [Candidatus Angelobacter sp.]